MTAFISPALVRCVRAAALIASAIASAGASAEGHDLHGTAVFSDFGQVIGADGFVYARNGHHRELYVAALGRDTADTPYWYVLRYAKDGSATKIFVSDPVPAGIAQISVARRGGGETSLIVVADRHGNLQEFDQKTKKLVATRPGDCTTRGGLAAFTTADMERDGIDEYISVCDDGTLIVSGSRYTTWSLPGVGGYRVAAANLDDDPAIEIVTTSGVVVDGDKHMVQWTSPQGFGPHFAFMDLGLGKRYPGLVTDIHANVTAFDIGAQASVWTLAFPDGVGGLAASDIDQDGKQELIVADAQWGNISAYDVATRALKGQIPVQGDGANNMVVANVTGDGLPDVIWASELDSNCGDCIYTGQWATKSVVWHSKEIAGPFFGPWVGDLDGDGKPEIVFASRGDLGRSDTGRLIVLDGETLQVRGISDPVMNGQAWAGLKDIRLGNLGDGRLSVLVAGDVLYAGAIEAWHFNADNTFDLAWTNAVRPQESFTSVQVADIDGTGKPTVVVGATSRLLAYDAATGALTWQSLDLEGWTTPGGLGIADFDGDGLQEMVVQTTDGLDYVFDGAGSHAVKAVFNGADGALATFQPAGELPQLQLGNQAGRASQWGWNGQHYRREFAWSTSGQPIVGLTEGPSGDWWVGTGDGVLTRYHGKKAVQATIDYGSGTGSHAAFLPSRGLMLTGGTYGLFAFKVDAP